MLDVLSMAAAELAVPFSTPRGVALIVLSAIGLAFVVAGTFAKTMLPLRSCTVASQLAFMASALLAPNVVAILVYLVLIPVNGYRLREIVTLTKRVRAATAEGSVSGLWLKPYMRRKLYRAGELVFRRGDDARSLYLLVSGELEFVEAGVSQPVGEMFGEIGFFSPGHQRTMTARCVTDCEVLAIEEPTFQQLYYQSPEFAFRVSNLIAARLSADVRRLQDRLEQASAHPSHAARPALQS